MPPIMNWPVSKDDEERICQAALAARENAYAPYSRFRVGAALLTTSGTVHAGCNVENASYGLCMCAERCAVGVAVAAGDRKFAAVAIATGSTPPSAPCGMCRQTLMEFDPDLPLLLINDKGDCERTVLRELFPSAFNSDQLSDGADEDRA